MLLHTYDVLHTNKQVQSGRLGAECSICTDTVDHECGTRLGRFGRSTNLRRVFFFSFLFFSFLVSLSPRSRRFNLGRIQVFRRLRSISLDAIRGSGILVVAFAHIVLALSETRSLSRKGYTVLR